MNNASTFNWLELLPLQPELVLLIGAMLFLLIGAFRGNRETSHVILGGVLLIAVSLVWLSANLSAPSIQLFSGLLIIDGFSQYAKLLLMFSTALVLILSHAWLKRHSNPAFEFPVLMLLSLVGMMVMVSANDFMTLYVGLELSSLALYVLAAFDRDNEESAEAGIKYFILGALASGMMLFGASLVYGYTGSTNFTVIANLLAGCEDCQNSVSYGAVVGMVLLTVGFCFKISAVPFHMWTPDVYTGAPTPVTMFFATAPKIAALIVFFRVLMGPLEEMFPDWQNILAFVANASMIIGALGAIMQTNFKRLLAYGSIGHIGYALVGVAAGSPEGLKAVLIYITLYMFMAIGTFGFILFMRREGKYLESLSDLSGLSRTCPMAAIFLLIMMFSMAGIPPFAGFWGKMFVFSSAIESGLIAMTIVGLLTSVIAAYYYLKVVKIMYFDAPVAPFDKDIPHSAQAVLLLTAIVTAGFVLYPEPLLHAAAIAANAMG
jgi:NADH-quinone oxidoreductase subunit N